VRLTLSVSDTAGPLPAIAEETGERVSVERHVPKEDGYILYVSADDTDDLLETAESAYPTSARKAEGGAVSLRAPNSPVLEAVTRRDGKILRCGYDELSSRYLFEVELGSGDDARELVGELSGTHDASVLSHRTSPDDDADTPTDDIMSELTERQIEVLETAYYEGFFGWPRESTGEEVAEKLGVSPPTLTST